MRNIIHFWRRPNPAPSNEAFEEYLQPHIDTLYRLAAFWCGDHDDAEDLLQATLCKLFTVRQQLPQIEQLRPWLVRVMYRLFIDTIRRNSRNPLLLGDQAAWNDEEQDYAPLWSNDNRQQPEDIFEINHLTKNLQLALNRLPASRRALLIMHDVENYSLQEISLAMEIPVGTVKSRLHRARERLREILLADGTFSAADAFMSLRTEK